MKRKFSLGLDSLTPEEINTLTDALLKTEEQKKESYINTYHESQIKAHADNSLEIKKIKINNSNKSNSQSF
jgi:hypothetical protein